MASVLTDFTKKREFLVCMDSDGCVMDTVSIKHTIVMCPELIRVFALDDHADFVASAWEEINLRNITRGLSRFESVVLVFDRLKNRGIKYRLAGLGFVTYYVGNSLHAPLKQSGHFGVDGIDLGTGLLQKIHTRCSFS